MFSAPHPIPPHPPPPCLDLCILIPFGEAHHYAVFYVILSETLLYGSVEAFKTLQHSSKHMNIDVHSSVPLHICLFLTKKKKRSGREYITEHKYRLITPYESVEEVCVDLDVKRADLNNLHSWRKNLEKVFKYLFRSSENVS
jgi:hypothetical protein